MRERYGRWEVRGTLGKGGMGEVWRAVDPATGHYAAVKVARLRRVARESLEQEVAALRRLRHPGIVRFLDHGVDGDAFWVATELVTGQALREQLDHGRASSDSSADTVQIEDPTSVDSTYDGVPVDGWSFDAALGAMSVVRRVCDPLAWLHGEGFVHGDIKPENILVRPDGNVVLVDLGLTRPFDVVGRDTLPVDRRISGTVAYLSPEQCAGRLPDGRSDLYSLGCVLFELLTGAPPFGRGFAAARSHPTAVAPRLRELVPAPADLEDLVARLLEKEPARRMAYATDVADWLEELGVPAPPNGGPRPRRVLYRPRLVGRDVELAQLREARVAATTGEPGSGKTRLCAALAEDPDLPAVTGLGSGPGGVAGTLVSSLLAACPDDELHRRFSPLSDVLGVVDPRVSAALGEAVPALDPSDGAVVEAIVEAVGLSAPVRVLLDELNALSERDEALCARLVRQPPPGVRVVVAGPGPALLRGLGRAGAELVWLGRLPNDAVEQLLRDALADDAPAPELVAFLRDRADGDPRLAWEYAQALVERGDLRRVRGRWVVRDRDRLASALPASVEALVRGRFAALPSVLRLAAGRAAVCGLGSLSDDALEALAAARIVGRGSTTTGWRFTAPALAELARLSLSDAERAQAHADAFAALPPAASDADRAEHAVGAGRTDDARDALRRLIPRATAAGRWPDVVRAAEVARALPGNPPEVDAELRLALARAYRARGHFAAAVDVVEGLTDDMGDRIGRDVRFQRSRALARSGRIAEGLALLRDAVETDPVDPARWLEALAETFAEAGDLPASIDARRRALALLEVQGDPMRLARGRVALANVLQRQDRVQEAEALVERALPVLDAASDALWKGHARVSSALVWVCRDEARVKRDCLLAIGHYRAAGMVPNQIQTIGALTECLRRRREFDEATQWLGRMEALADETGNERLICQALFTRASLLNAVDDPAALGVLTTTAPRLQRSGFAFGEGLLRAQIVAKLRSDGRWDEIGAHLDRIREIASSRDDVGLTYVEAAERALLRHHRGEEASAEVARALALLDNVDRPDDHDRALSEALRQASRR